MPQPLLEGTVDTRDRDVERLTALVDDLTGELEVARAEAKLARQQAVRAMSNLRRQLSPLYQALQMVFGELDAVNIPDASVSAAPTQDARVAAVWQSWKNKLGGKRAEFIAALQEHGEMTSAQLKVATHSGSSTVPQIIYQLNQLGLISKNGGKYSLKQL